jgi:hypothetical protein
MRRIPLTVLFLAAIMVTLATAPLLDCEETAYRRWASPDGAFTLTVCRRPMLFAMPGQGSDAAGYAVLHAQGRVAGVVSIDSVNGITYPPNWQPGSVELPLEAEFELPDSDSPIVAVPRDAAWRLRTALGLIPSSDEFR